MQLWNDDQECETLAPVTGERKLRNEKNLRTLRQFIALILAEVHEPKSYTETMESTEKHDWNTATDEEIASLKKNPTCDLVELPIRRRDISNCWV